MARTYRKSSSVVENQERTSKESDKKVVKAVTNDVKARPSANPSDDSDSKGKRQYRKRVRKPDCKDDTEQDKLKKQRTTVQDNPEINVPQSSNTSDDSKKEHSEPKKVKLQYGKRVRKSEMEQAWKEALKQQTSVYDKLTNNNRDKDKDVTASKASNVKSVGEVRCHSDCLNMMKVNQVKQLLENSQNLNSDLIIQRLKNVLSPKNQSEEQDDAYQLFKQETTGPEDDTTNPDDPPTTARKVTKPAPTVTTGPKYLPTANIKNLSTKEKIKPKVERLFNCFFCTQKEGKNQSGFNHMAVCLWSTGAYPKYLPTGDKSDKLGDIDENGRKFKYYCKVPNCDRNGPRSKPTGYKDFSIHCGWKHGILERWAQESDSDEAKHLYTVLRTRREEAGEQLPPIPAYEIEEVHSCLLSCGTKDLSLAPEKIQSTRFHYSSCLYEQGGGVYFEKYKDENHPDNFNEDGITPKDVMGTFYKFTCELCPPSNRNRTKMSYKSYVIHKAYLHDGLQEILSQHEDENVRALVPRLVKQEP